MCQYQLRGRTNGECGAFTFCLSLYLSLLMSFFLLHLLSSLFFMFSDMTSSRERILDVKMCNCFTARIDVITQKRFLQILTALVLPLLT